MMRMELGGDKGRINGKETPLHLMPDKGRSSMELSEKIVR